MSAERGSIESVLEQAERLAWLCRELDVAGGTSEGATVVDVVEKYRDWVAKPDEDLIAQWDAQASHVGIGLDFIAGELQRRQMERAGRRMERLTWTVTALTAVSVIVSAVALVVALR